MRDIGESEAPCIFLVNMKESKKIGGGRSIDRLRSRNSIFDTKSKVPCGYAKYNDSSSERLWSKLRETLTVPQGMWLLLGSTAQGALHSRDGTATPDDYRSPSWPPAEDRASRAARTKVMRGVEIINRTWRYLDGNVVIQCLIFMLNELLSRFILRFYFCKDTSERKPKKSLVISYNVCLPYYL